jgi:hypothetical protein
MSNRRKFIIGLGAGAFVAPFRSFAQQQSKVWRVGVLSIGSAAPLSVCFITPGSNLSCF